MTHQLNIAMVGHGAIAGYVVEQILPVYGINIAALVCRECSLPKAQAFASNRFPVFTDVSLLDPKPDLLVDCAGYRPRSACEARRSRSRKPPCPYG